MNLNRSMRATPAGKLMNVRTIGSRRLKNAVAEPYFVEEVLGQLDLVRPDEQVLAPALEERPAAPRADAVADHRADGVADCRRRSRPARSSTARGSAARWPSDRRPGSRRSGRISSDGSGIIADSIAMATITPPIADAPYRLSRNGMTILSMKWSIDLGLAGRRREGWLRRPVGRPWPGCGSRCSTTSGSRLRSEPSTRMRIE